MQEKSYSELVDKGLLNPPPPDNGRFQFGIYVTSAVCQQRELFCDGDLVEVMGTGALVILRKRTKSKGKLRRLWEFLRSDRNGHYMVNLMIPAGQWLACYLTDPIDGCPVAIFDWPDIGVHLADR